MLEEYSMPNVFTETANTSAGDHELDYLEPDYLSPHSAMQKTLHQQQYPQQLWQELTHRSQQLQEQHLPQQPPQEPHQHHPSHQPPQEPQQHHPSHQLQQQCPTLQSAQNSSSSTQPATPPVMVSVNQRRLPVPCPVPYHCFSDDVIQAIDNNNIKGIFKIRLIRQAASFFMVCAQSPRTVNT